MGVGFLKHSIRIRKYVTSITLLYVASITPALADDSYALNMKVEDMVRQELKAPDYGFMYRYDGNPIYLHSNEYLTVTQSWDIHTRVDHYQIKYIKYDSDSYNQISELIDGGAKKPTEIMKKLKRIYFVGDEKSCPDIASRLSEIYKSAKSVVDAMNFPNGEKRLLMGAAYDYQFYFTDWNGDRFIYQGSLSVTEPVKKINALTQYVMSCGQKTE